MSPGVERLFLKIFLLQECRQADTKPNDKHYNFQGCWTIFTKKIDRNIDVVVGVAIGVIVLMVSKLVYIFLHKKFMCAFFVVKPCANALTVTKVFGLRFFKAKNTMLVFIILATIFQISFFLIFYSLSGLNMTYFTVFFKFFLSDTQKKDTEDDNTLKIHNTQNGKFTQQ